MSGKVVDNLNLYKEKSQTNRIIILSFLAARESLFYSPSVSRPVDDTIRI